MFLDNIVLSLETKKSNNAFCIGDVFYSYNDLGNRITAIMAMLSLQPAPNERYAILCTDHIDTYATILALWFTGRAYVPLGLHNPVERNLTILKEAEVGVIISTNTLADDRYRHFGILNPELAQQSQPEIRRFTHTSGDLAYILFTSGSTGVPKGVPISILNLSAFVRAFADLFPVSESDRCLQMFELTFDVSVSSFVIPLMVGACIYTVPSNVLKYVHVLKLIEKYKLTSIQIVPSIIKLAKPLLSRFSSSSVKNCILTGEATSVDLIPIWRKSLPSARIYNFYGPTETTIYCSRYDMNGESVKNYNAMAAIGKPLAGISFAIVDEDFKIVEVGRKGELLISGEQTTSGYVNNADKNATSFVNLIIDGRQMVFYRSGDLCYQDNEEDYYYCGRIDNQVKIQGFRVELSEIEMTVRNLFSLNNVVIVGNNKEGVELILVLETTTKIDWASLTEQLRLKLPSYMIPSRVFSIESFPLTSSGKTDRPRIRNFIDGRA